MFFLKSKAKKEMNEILSNTKEYSVEEFFKHREYILKQYTNLKLDGSYVLYNDKKHQYYVGQSINVINRIHQHFTAHGNGDVYHDYKNGDSFRVKYILLSQTKYKSLNELERKLILAYQAYGTGYNKTKGNK